LRRPEKPRERSGKTPTLGLYQHFPATLHNVVPFTFTIPNRKIQQALVQTIRKLNGENLKLEDMAYPSLRECTIILEFGIAQGDSFTYLDDEETARVMKSTNKAPLPVMDFVCSVRYYRVREGKMLPLRFDYYMLRFAFEKGYGEMQVSHERGPRHVTPEDIANLIMNRINESSSRRIVKLG
jgi:hypothetical protein